MNKRIFITKREQGRKMEKSGHGYANDHNHQQGNDTYTDLLQNIVE